MFPDFAREYYVDFVFLSKIRESGFIKSFPNKTHILIEFSFTIPPINWKSIIFEIENEGFLPILAHPERYIWLKEYKNFIMEFKDRGGLLQGNIGSFDNMYGNYARKNAVRLMKDNLFDFLATDTHKIEQLNILGKKTIPFIKKKFGERIKKRPANFRGNVGLIYFFLSNKPKPSQHVVINFGRAKGDKSIFLLEGSAYGNRLTFDAHNWNKPALAAIQLDPKINHRTTALFTAHAGNIPLAWSLTFFFMAAMFILFFLYHKFILPYPDSDHPSVTRGLANIWKEFIYTFAEFFRQDKIGWVLTFLLIYRLAESQLVKLASPFMLDAQEVGGLALTTGQVGFIYGTVGILFLTLGGLLGGFVAAKKGLKYWLWWMAISINLPDVVYVYLSYAQPDNLWIINLCVAIEQFGYGFGFTAYMLYMIYASQGEHKTANFAIATGFMALGMMIPGMFSGWLQELVGYRHFFIWVMSATIPGFLILPFIPLDKDFGKKKK